MNGIVPTGGFDPGGPWINRWVLRGTLTTRSPLHVGSGRSLDFIDACTERDASGRPVVPGSGLRGTLRGTLRARTGVRKNSQTGLRGKSGLRGFARSRSAGARAAYQSSFHPLVTFAVAGGQNVVDALR